MKLWLFQYVEPVSENYHDGGGLIVVAPDEGGARSLVEARDIHPADLDFSAADAVYTVSDGEPAVYVFPDAGCC